MRCQVCGAELRSSEARREFIPDASDNDDFDRVGTAFSAAHWETYCRDTAACKARIEAQIAASEPQRLRAAALRAEAAAQRAAEKKAKQEVWARETAGLHPTSAAPVGAWKRTGRAIGDGGGRSAEEVQLANGELGWRTDSGTWLLSAAAKAEAEAEAARLHRVYQWWRPTGYRPDSYPGPGVPEAELSEEERAEVARCYAAYFAAIEAEWRRLIPIEIKPGNWPGARGCEAWEALTALGAEIEIQIDPEEIRAFSRWYGDDCRRRREERTLTVILRAKLPARAHNKDGSIKAAVASRLPRNNKTRNRYLVVRVDYT